MKKLEFGKVYMGLFAVAAIAMVFLMDSSSGILRNITNYAGSIVLLSSIFMNVLMVGFHHVSMKGIFDYYDYRRMYELAAMSPQGAGLSLIATGLWAIAISLVFIGTTMLLS